MGRIGAEAEGNGINVERRCESEVRISRPDVGSVGEGGMIQTPPCLCSFPLKVFFPPSTHLPPSLSKSGSQPSAAGDSGSPRPAFWGSGEIKSGLL